jgi:glucokinase-like ROK family protein
MKTGDQTLVKKINKSIVLSVIQNKCPLSRAQISELTGLNKATVSTLVSELIETNLVYEIGPGQSSGGRRPVMLFFNKNAGYSIGVDLGVNYILAVLTDLQGNIVQEKKTPLFSQSVNDVLPKLKQLIQSLIDETPESPYGIVGIGIGVPGITDSDGKILFAPNLKWHNVNIKEDLEREFELPVTVDNEANAGSYGEKRYGAGKDVSNLIYVSAGIGIGTGIILDNELYKGVSGVSGEMGHFTIEANGKKCRCGNRGCWELYASENALLEQARQLSVFENDPKLDIDQLIEAANQDNSEVINLFYHIGEYLGIGLTNIVNTFNPELVIIGNRLSQIRDWIKNPINLVLEQRLLTYHREPLKVTFSELGIYSCALGSSSFAISSFFARDKVTVE